MKEVPIETRLANLVSTYPCPQLALLPVLWHVAQESEISDSVIKIVAGLCEVEPESIRVLFDSYPGFFHSPRKNVVCMGLSCFLNGAQRVYSALCEDPKKSGLKGIGVELSPCLGYCFAAPVIRDAEGVLCRAQLSHELPHKGFE